MKRLKTIISLTLALALVLSMAILSFAADNGAEYYLDAESRNGNVITVATGESVKISFRVKSASDLLIMQAAVPYDDGLFDVTTDENSGDTLELALGARCVKVMKSNVKAGDEIVSEITFAPKAGVTSGETVLKTAMIKAYNAAGEQITVGGDTVTLRIGEKTVEPVKHEHEYVSEWSRDASGHWHACVSKTGTCAVPKADSAAHVSDNGTVIRAATATVAGTREYKCSVCGYVIRTESIPATGGSGSGTRPATKPVTQPEVDINDPETPLADGILPFDDVHENDWFYGDVGYVYTEGLMVGTSGTKFSPHMGTTRAMITTVIYRMEGEPAAAYKGAFDDVPDGTWYSKAIEWAAENDIVFGYGNGKFGPDDQITREQLCAILHRYAAFKGYDTDARGSIAGFTDNAKVGDWAVDAVRWCVANEIIKGNENNELMPAGNATRAQIAAVFHRFCLKYAEMPDLYNAA